MTARLLNFPSSRPLPKATIQASVVSSTVINTPGRPVVGHRLSVRLADVLPKERRKLVEVPHRGQPKTAEGIEDVG